MPRFSTNGQNLDDDWNPMREAYQDPNFNTYRDGPGANLDLERQPCFAGSNQGSSGPFKVYVGNIPDHVDQEGIENIFRSVAPPVNVYKAKPVEGRNKSYAFVTFESFRDAENAIRKVHRRPPLYFNVEFAKGPNTDDLSMKMKHINLNGSQQTPEVAKPAPRSSGISGKGRGLAIASYVDPRSAGPQRDCEEDADIRQFQQYNGSNYDESNAKILGITQRASGPRGPHKFVMGRGCFDREMDQICQPKKLGKVVDNVYEAKNSIENFVRRKSGSYESLSKRNYPSGLDRGTCTYCGEPAVQFCANCKDWYCSKDCQKKDWPRHKRFCQIPVPETKISLNGEQTQQNSVQSLPSPRKDKSKIDGFKQHDGNHCKKEVDGISVAEVSPPKGKNFNHKKQLSQDFQTQKRDSFKSHTPSSPGKETKQYNKGKYDDGKVMGLGTSTSFQKDKKKEISESSFGKNGEKNLKDFRQSAKSGRHNSENISKTTHNSKTENVDVKPILGCEVTEELPDTAFVNVKVAVQVGPDEFWVQLDVNENKIHQISAAVQNGLNDPVKPSIGIYCLAKYMDFWYRAKITSLEPELKVFFIDYGNEETLLPNELMTIPKTLTELKSQAIRIKLAPGSLKNKISESGVLSVKSVQYKNGVHIVHVEGENYEIPTADVVENNSNSQMIKIEENCNIALQNVTLVLEPNMRCIIHLSEHTSDDEFSAFLVPMNLMPIYTSLVNELPKAIEGILEKGISDKFEPEVGDAVVANSSEGWVRAYVINVSKGKEYTVASIDMAYVENVKEVLPIPKEYREIPYFGVQCRKLEKLKQISASCFVDIESCGTDTVLGCVEIEEGITCKIEIKKWEVPYELYQELKCVELKDGECVISAEMSAVELYVRPTSPSCIETFNRLLVEVGKLSYSSPNLKYVPKIGEVLGARFSEDGHYYRAVVRGVDPSKGIKVQYIDYGNVEYVEKEKLIALPENLRSVECSVVKVILEDVIDKPLNVEVQKLFKDLILGNTKLKVKLTNPKSNRVRLYLKDGTNLNEKINNILQPGWKKGIVDSHIYSIQDVQVEELEVNSTLELVIMSVIGNSIVVRPATSNLVNVLNSDLQQTIDDYCKKNTEPYTPREDELCVAKIENNWYRCLCLSGGNELSLYLLDVGTVDHVSHEDIRKYVQEFTCLPAVGVRCEVQIKGEISNFIQENIRAYLNAMKIIQAKVLKQVIAKSGLKSYLIAVPELDSFLQTLQ